MSILKYLKPLLLNDTLLNPDGPLSSKVPIAAANRKVSEAIEKLPPGGTRSRPYHVNSSTKINSWKVSY